MKTRSIDFSGNITKFIINYAPLILYLILAFSNLPWPIVIPSAGLDPSWNIGMNVAFLNKFQFGKEVAFTYGLLGFLSSPLLLDYNLWKSALAFQIFVDFFYTISLYLFLRCLSVKWYYYLILVPILLLGLIEYQVMALIAISISFFVIILRDKSDWISSLGLILASITMSVISLIKFNLLLVSLYIILLTSCALILRNGEFKQCAYIVLSYVLSFAAIMTVTGQSIKNITDYLINGFEISNGYNSAMGTYGPSWQVILGLISVLALGLIFLYFIFINDKNAILFFSLNLFSLFSFYKLGFVRQDTGHIVAFFFGFIIFFGLLLVLQLLDWNKKERNKLKYIIILINILMLFILTLGASYAGLGLFNNHYMEKASSYEFSLNMLNNRTLFDDQIMRSSENIRKNYPFDQQLIKYINGTTTDIFPWDIALCWAYGLNWSPRPVFQSYSAYTMHLDYLNKRHFVDGRAPQTILYAYKTIDERYPIFDEPATFRAILSNYTYINSSGEFVLLKHMTNTNEQYSEVNLGIIESKFGMYIPIPKYSKGFVFGEIEINYSLFGKVKGILYKPSPIYIRFKFPDGSISNKFRFIADNARNGIFLSEYLETRDDLSLLFQGEMIKDNEIEGIYIEADKPDCYQDVIRINFLGIPTNISQKSSREPRFIRRLRSINATDGLYIRSGMGCINGDCRPIIFQHPLPSNKSIILFDNNSIPRNALLKFGLALDPQVWFPEKGDGVLFEIQIISKGTYETPIHVYIDPKNHPDQRKWNHYEVNLSSFENKNVTFLFKTTCGPNNDCAYDWAWWGEPVISTCSAP